MYGVKDSFENKRRVRRKEGSQRRQLDQSWTKVWSSDLLYFGLSLLVHYYSLSSLYDATQASPPLLIRLVYIVSNHIGTFCKKYEEGREEVNVV